MKFVVNFLVSCWSWTFCQFWLLTTCNAASNHIRLHLVCALCRKKVTPWINISSHIRRGYVWRKNNKSSTRKVLCSYTRNKFNTFQLNKNGFEDTLLSTASKPWIGFKVFHIWSAIDRSATLLLCKCYKWMPNNVRNQAKIFWLEGEL